MALTISLSVAMVARADDAKAPASAPPAATAPDASTTPTANAPDAAAVPATGTTESAPKMTSKAYTGTAGQLEKHMESLFEASQKVNSPDAAVKKASRAKIDTAVDWDQIAQTCLGKSEWKKQSASNRSAFRNLLKDVIERTAFSRMDKFWKNATASIDKIDVEGATAHVLAHFKSGGDRMKLEYYFHKKGKDWLIDDIGYNGMRYSLNINEQLEAFLREKSFSELLKNLRKRRDELISDAKQDAR